MNKLEKIPIEELEKEIQRRKEVKKQEKKKARIAYNKKILENKIALCRLLTHDRSSCAENDNAYFNREYCEAACNLCVLEELDEYNLDGVDIKLNITITEVKGE